MEVKRRSNVWNIIKLVVGALLVVLFLPMGATALVETLYYSDRLEQGIDELAAAKRVIGVMVPGKEAMNGSEEYIEPTITGTYKNRGIAGSSLGFYKKTGIQLHFVDYRFEDERFESEEAIQSEVKKRISELPEIDNSIVLYSYSTDYDYGSGYFYYQDDILYYGKNVMDYLAPEDLTMIEFYVKNYYDMFDYPDQFSKALNKVADSLANGYNTGELVNIRMLENDIRYYKEDLLMFRIGIAVSIIAVVVGVILLISGVKGVRSVNKINHEMMEAEIEYKQARATREILEADIDYVNTKEDNALLDKYSDD